MTCTKPITLVPFLITTKRFPLISNPSPMTSKHEVEVTVTSAKDLKNVNWRNGTLKPYAVVWVDPANKSTTRVDDEGDTSPYWDHVLVVPLNGPLEDSYLYIDVVHAGAVEGTKPLVGSARLTLREIIDEVGFGERISRKLELKRPSGRPQGKLQLEVVVHKARDMYYSAPESYYAPPPQATREYGGPGGYGNTYSAPPYPPQAGYPYGQPAYEQPQPAYGQATPAYGQGEYGQEKKSSKFGMGTGLAVGALGGVLGGLAIAEGIDYVEDKIADDAAEKVEDDLENDGYDGDDF